MAVDMSASNALEAAIDAKIAKAAPKRTQANGTVKRVDADGTAYVQLEGADVDTPVARTAAALKVGQEVGGTVSNGELVIDGNFSAPATDDSKALEAWEVADGADAKAVKAGRVAADAMKVADEAGKVAEATEQHFWHDGNGVHVTEAEGDATTEHNILMNSLGILLRKALNNLVSITASAVAFFDGSGNTAEHITAQFGGDGTKLYADGALRHKTDVDGSHYYAADGVSEILEIGTLQSGQTYYGEINFPGYNSIYTNEDGITVSSQPYNGNPSRISLNMVGVAGESYAPSVTLDSEGYATMSAGGDELIDMDASTDNLRLAGNIEIDGAFRFDALPNAGTNTDFFATGIQGFANGGRLRYKGLADMKSWLGLDALFKTASASQAWSSNIAAGNTQNVTVTLTVPSGYTIAAIRRVSSGNANVDIAGFYISGSTVVVALHNATSSARSSNNGVTVAALLAKSAFFG